MRILVSTDGQAYSEKAMHYAGYLFKVLKPVYFIFYVLEFSSSISEEMAKKYLHRGKSVLAKYSKTVKMKLEEGGRVEEVIREIQTDSYDLLVIGAKSASLSLGKLMGSNISLVESELLEKTTSSFLLVKDPSMRQKRVLICTDGSADSLAAVEFWGKLYSKQKPRNLRVNVINVIPEFYSRFKDILEPVAKQRLRSLQTLPHKRTKYLFEAKDILAKFGLESQVRLREGNAADEILREAGRGYDLIVLGMRGRKSKRKSTAGRHTLEVARKSKASVLAVKH